jgi:hypothetical protein
VIDLPEKKVAFIAGGGKYGSGALKYFMKNQSWNVVVCDEDEHCQASALVEDAIKLDQTGSAPRIRKPTLLVGSAVDGLVQFLSYGVIPEIVIPCVPFHFAAKVLTLYLTRKGLSVKPSSEDLKLAFESANLKEIDYRVDEDYALVVVSKMPFNLQCLSGCNEPEICPVTKRRLLRPMYALMADTLAKGKVDFVMVLRSWLMAPNIGGFSGDELKQTLDLCIQQEPCTIALATSCSCHAVANIFEIGD